jgi:hypothetical protein|eukprot:g1730.t1
MVLPLSLEFASHYLASLVLSVTVCALTVLYFRCVSAPKMGTKETANHSGAAPEKSLEKAEPTENAEVPPPREAVAPSVAAREDKMPPHPDFPQLIITDESASEGGTPGGVLYANTRSPITFRNKNFEGKMILMLRSEPLDPFFASHFQGRKRCMEVRIQGKFLKAPKGPVFFGGEIGKPMSLGIVLGPLARLMLSVIRTLTRGLFHASFGDTDPDERPHICTSFFAGVDQLVISMPGEELPDIMKDLGEPKESQKERKKMKVDPPIDLNATYSFSFHDMHIDIFRWKVVNLVKEMDLHSFWEDQPFRFVAYDVGGTPEAHRNQDKNYFLCFQIKHLVGMEQDTSTMDWPDSGSDESNRNSRELEEDIFSGGEGELDGTRELSTNALRRRLSSLDKQQGCSVPSWIEYSENRSKRVAFVVLVSPPNGTSRFVVRTVKQFKGLLNSLDGEAKGELKAIINTGKMSRDVSKSNKATFYETKRRALDLIIQNLPNTSRKNRLALFNFVKNLPNGLEHVILRPSLERTRFKVLSSRSSNHTANVFIESPLLYAEWESFWREGWATLSKVGNDVDGDEAKYELCFFRVHSQKPFFKIPSGAIIGASLLDQRCKTPFPMRNKCCFEVQTLGRVYCFLVASEELATEWVGVLNFTAGKSESIHLDLGGEDSDGYGRVDKEVAIDPRELFAIKSLRWESSKKLLNNRRLCFPGSPQGSTGGRCSPVVQVESLEGGASDEDSSGRSTSGAKAKNGSVGLNTDPCDLSAQLLRNALAISSSGTIILSSESKKFGNLLDLASQLKDIDYGMLLEKDEDLRQAKLLVFWLNIYHAILIHGTIMFGKSKSLFAATSFMNSVVYEIFREPYRHIYSMVEIEHCILRAHMSKPGTSKIIQNMIPSFNGSNPKWDFAIPGTEPRINFVLNCGSASCLNEIPIFTLERLDSQLNRASELFLCASVQVDIQKRIIKLPKICEWYKKDLTQEANPTAVMKYVGKMMGKKGTLFRKFIRTPGSLTINYITFSWSSGKTLHVAMWDEDENED